MPSIFEGTRELTAKIDSFLDAVSQGAGGARNPFSAFAWMWMDCARQSGAYCNKALPDLIFFDITDTTENNTAVLSEVAFGQARSRVPVVLLTNSNSPQLFENGRIADEQAVMFSPTSLASFVSKMKNGKRSAFFRALKTLYEYGPILVRLPVTARHRDYGVTALTA